MHAQRHHHGGDLRAEEHSGSIILLSRPALMRLPCACAYQLVLLMMAKFEVGARPVLIDAQKLTAFWGLVVMGSCGVELM